MRAHYLPRWMLCSRCHLPPLLSYSSARKNDRIHNNYQIHKNWTETGNIFSGYNSTLTAAKQRKRTQTKRSIMIGAIAGDVIGSVYEHEGIKTTDFPLFLGASKFTDDTVLTVAVAHAILTNGKYGDSIKEFGLRYPRAGYGQTFYKWLVFVGNNGDNGQRPYNSWGNGSAMRVSPVGWAFDSIDKVLEEAYKSAAVTHNHPEGIKGAQATALAIFLARQGKSKAEIRSEISNRFHYNLDRTVEEIRPSYRFDVSCQGSVPESIICFLDSISTEDAIRKAVSLGGDADTMACIAGGIAEAFYGNDLSPGLVTQIRQRLPNDLLSVVDAFDRTFNTREALH